MGHGVEEGEGGEGVCWAEVVGYFPVPLSLWRPPGWEQSVPRWWCVVFSYILVYCILLFPRTFRLFLSCGFRGSIHRRLF